MKKLVVLVFIISVSLNIGFIILHVIGTMEMKRLHSLFDIKDVTYKDGLKSFFTKLNDLSPNAFQTKNCFFIQTWDTLTGIDSRVRSMQLLDSLFSEKKYNPMEKLFVSEMSPDAIETFKRNHKLHFNSFKVITDADDFISSVFTLKKAKVKSHPMQVVIDRDGKILFYNSKLSGMEERDSTIYYVNKIMLP